MLPRPHSSATFRADWDEALEEARELLEAEARRRAAIGVDEPVFYKGKVVGHIRKYSDNLLMFLLKAHWPEKFRDNYAVEHSGPGFLVIKPVYPGSPPRCQGLIWRRSAWRRLRSWLL